MRTFFFPKSVVVIGVSSSRTNLARRILHNLKRFGYTGKVHAVGPRVEEVEGHQVHGSVLDIKENIDLAIVLTPAKAVPEIADQCGKKGIKRLLIESGGFGEYEGTQSPTEQKLVEICKKHDIRFIGPNCIGIINRQNGLCTPFARVMDRFYEGGVSILAQSGGVGASFAMDMTFEFVGVSKFVSFGNGVDVDEAELIRFFDEDEETAIIAPYIEGIQDGRKFLELTSQVKKPIVMLKSNIGGASSKIACSHSAALAGDNDVISAACQQAGIVRVPNYLSWTNATKQLLLPPFKGKRLGVLSRSGGHAVLAADAIGEFGFELPPFPTQFFEEVKEYFQGGIINLQNPLDLGQIFYYPVLAHIIEAALKVDELDGVLFIHTYDAEHEGDMAHTLISQIPELMERYNKPVTIVLHTQHEERGYVRENFKIPVFRTPYNAVEALHYSHLNYCYLKDKKPWPKFTQTSMLEHTKPLLDKIVAEKREPLLEEALEICRAQGLPLLPYEIANSKEDAIKAAERLGYPVVLKLSHPEASHKSDVGGVALDIRNDDELIQAFERLQQAALNLPEAPYSISVQQLAAPGAEIIVGGKTDPIFGPVVLTGSGGIMTEICQDSTVRVAPIDEKEAEKMLTQIKAFKQLKGFRGQPELDIKALTEVISKISHMLVELEDIGEIDLNPVIVHEAGKGISIVDARIILKRETPADCGC